MTSGSGSSLRAKANHAGSDDYFSFTRRHELKISLIVAVVVVIFSGEDKGWVRLKERDSTLVIHLLEASPCMTFLHLVSGACSLRATLLVSESHRVCRRTSISLTESCSMRSPADLARSMLGVLDLSPSTDQFSPILLPSRSVIDVHMSFSREGKKSCSRCRVVKSLQDSKVLEGSLLLGQLSL
ncbi:hypothetical protein LR48_Vigan1293s000900 [Vigna angularis]|uniref:Uncharacterized protein n=1 Tax=Phaseolus angularis TaxID=3914 RepID=A0A0L9TIV7_PHAAN|nr:hypothetical protein LR48_Vigan1293s000900 [Vigna angularis]